jgi:ectoine hydroxylase-related dioxygenase (phytanoyl-CoA dioxygenase family)
MWIRGALDEQALADLEETYCACNKPGMRLKNGLNGAVHTSAYINSLIAQIMPGYRPVRTLVFDKTPDQNWGVPWHQDRVIAVKEKYKIDGFRAWTNKAGIWHVEPPVNVLADMVFIRIHLDDTDEENGCLELARGSHIYGRVRSEGIADIVATSSREICRAQRGDILIVKALTLHRSLRATRPNQRRVFRVDYAARELIKPLEWAADTL